VNLLLGTHVLMALVTRDPVFARYGLDLIEA